MEGIIDDNVIEKDIVQITDSAHGIVNSIVNYEKNTVEWCVFVFLYSSAPRTPKAHNRGTWMTLVQGSH